MKKPSLWPGWRTRLLFFSTTQRTIHPAVPMRTSHSMQTWRSLRRRMSKFLAFRAIPSLRTASLSRSLTWNSTWLLTRFAKVFWKKLIFAFRNWPWPRSLDALLAARSARLSWSKTANSLKFGDKSKYQLMLKQFWPSADQLLPIIEISTSPCTRFLPLPYS